MRIRLSEFRKIIHKFISEAMDEMEQESVDRLNRARDGYGETEFEESIQQEDHTAHSKESGYSDEVVEALTGASGGMDKPKTASSSAALHTRDKSQMKGVGPRPTMANAFNDPGKKQEAAAASDQEVPHTGKSSGPMNGMQMIKKNPNGSSNLTKNGNKFKYIPGVGVHKQDEAMTGASDPNKQKQSTSSSAALHTRDKSKMQGVGPRPTMATAFGDQEQQKKEAEDNQQQQAKKDPNVHGPLSGNQSDGKGFRPSYDKNGNVSNRPGQKKTNEEEEPNFNPGKTNVLDKDFVHPGAKERQQIKQGRQDKIKQISKQQQAQMHKDGWKFEKHPSGEGNWSATPPPVQKHESKKNKKR
jgi:hypothetical protein